MATEMLSARYAVVLSASSLNPQSFSVSFLFCFCFKEIFINQCVLILGPSCTNVNIASWRTPTQPESRRRNISPIFQFFQFFQFFISSFSAVVVVVVVATAFLYCRGLLSLSLSLSLSPKASHLSR